MTDKKKQKEPDSAAKIGLALFTLAGVLLLILGASMMLNHATAVIYSSGDRYGQSPPSPNPVDGLPMLILGAAIMVLATIAFYQMKKGDNE